MLYSILSLVRFSSLAFPPALPPFSTMPSRRPPPCLTVCIPGKTGRYSRNLSSSVLGISTYSHRIAKRVQHPIVDPARQQRSDVADAEEMATVATAQVGSRAPSRLLVRPPRASTSACSTRSDSHIIPISVGVQPPTPDHSALLVSADLSPSTRRRRIRSEDSPKSRAVKQSRRVASTYSITASTGGIGAPDLTGASGLSIALLPATVSLEDLTILSAATNMSSSEAVENQPRRPYSTHSSTYTAPFAPLPAASTSHLPLSSHAAPPARQHSQSDFIPHHPPAPAYEPAAIGASRFREILSSAPALTEADKYKRLYLCPWEEKGTSARSLRARLVGGGGEEATRWERDPEKGGREERVEQSATAAQRRRKKLIFSIALLLLAIAIFADLIALNVRVFAGRDAYLNE